MDNKALLIEMVRLVYRVCKVFSSVRMQIYPDSFEFDKKYPGYTSNIFLLTDYTKNMDLSDISVPYDEVDKKILKKEVESLYYAVVDFAAYLGIELGEK